MSLAKAPAGGIVRISLDNSWRTPERLLDAARAYFRGPIPLDPASGPDNPTRALAYYTGEEPSAPPTSRQAALFSEEEPKGLARSRVSGLELPWDAPTWCNPPYGRELRAWLAKMIREAARGTEVIALLPCARFEQSYMHDVLAAAAAVCWVRRRVDFISSIDGQATRGNPYASMILGLAVDRGRFGAAFGPLGLCQALGPLGKP